MISKILYALESGVGYTRKHPQLLLALTLMLILPLLMLWASNEFLRAGQQNTDTLAYQRIGLLNDSFNELALASDLNPEALQSSIDSIAALNPDISKFRIVIEQNGELVSIAALDKSKLGEPEVDRSIYDKSFGEETGIAFPFLLDGREVIQSFRAIKRDNVLLGYIFVESDQTALNDVLDARKRTAYVVLGILYFVLVIVAFWLVKITDYRYLYQESQNAIKTKDLFTNMIAHELRAPLTAIRGYASMVEESRKIGSEEKMYALRVRQSSERLIAIVNDLLDVARIQSGKLKIDIGEHDLSEIIQAVVDELTPSAKEKGIELRATGTDISHAAVVDDKRLHQALTNLVSNALKYTKEGTIEVTIAEKARNFEIRVKDTGMGISAEDQKKLFAPFFRVESQDVSAITGTGLGMWITRQLIELMGATIGVESIKNVGTHVVVTVQKNTAQRR